MLKFLSNSNTFLRKGVVPMSKKKTYVTFEESLEDDDWGLIIGKNGNLKGMFIPEGQQEEWVPESIVEICEKYFGVDLDADNDNTLH